MRFRVGGQFAGSCRGLLSVGATSRLPHPSFADANDTFSRKREKGPIKIFVVAGEHSGDQLGFKLMQALRAMTGGRVCFRGVGGEAMAREGLVSLFPLDDIAVVGLVPVIRRLVGAHRTHRADGKIRARMAARYSRPDRQS